MKVDHERKVITFRQSDLDTYATCPERARVKWFEAGPDGATDATATGSALHYPIEVNLQRRKVGGDALTTTEMIDIAKAEYERIEREEGIRYVKEDKRSAMLYLEMGIPAWRREIEPHIAIGPDLHIEEHFDVHLMKWGEWEIRLAGTPDCVDRYHPWDWKTAAQGYKQWEKQRWAIQPTVYAHAAVTLGWLKWPVKFKYGVIEKFKTKEVASIVTVMRDAEHVDWLCQQINSILVLWAKLGERGPWPLVDAHALCSEKWCTNWSNCKGKIIPAGKFMWKAT